MIGKGTYTPQAYLNNEIVQWRFRQALHQVISGNKAIKIIQIKENDKSQDSTNLPKEP